MRIPHVNRNATLRAVHCNSTCNAARHCQLQRAGLHAVIGNLRVIRTVPMICWLWLFLNWLDAQAARRNALRGLRHLNEVHLNFRVVSGAFGKAHAVYLNLLSNGCNPLRDYHQGPPIGLQVRLLIIGRFMLNNQRWKSQWTHVVSEIFPVQTCLGVLRFPCLPDVSLDFPDVTPASSCRGAQGAFSNGSTMVPHQVPPPCHR